MSVVAEESHALRVENYLPLRVELKEGIRESPSNPKSS